MDPFCKAFSLIIFFFFDKNNVLTEFSDETKLEEFFNAEKSQDIIQKELHILKHFCNTDKTKFSSIRKTRLKNWKLLAKTSARVKDHEIENMNEYKSSGAT